MSRFKFAVPSELKTDSVGRRFILKPDRRSVAAPVGDGCQSASLQKTVSGRGYGERNPHQDWTRTERKRKFS